MFASLHQSVQEDEKNNKPIKTFRFDQKSEPFAISSVPSSQRFTKINLVEFSKDSGGLTFSCCNSQGSTFA